jgi:hypothetical protein
MEQKKEASSSSSRHIKENDTFNANSHVMMSPFFRMAPLYLAFTLEDNRASLSRRHARELEISTCCREGLNGIHEAQYSVLFILSRILAIRNVPTSLFILMLHPCSRKSCICYCPTPPSPTHATLFYVMLVLAFID